MAFKYYAKGAGSLLELFPEKNNFHPVIENNPEKRIANAWDKVGNSFRTAIDEHQSNVKK